MPEAEETRHPTLLKIVNVITYVFFFSTGLYSTLSPEGRHGKITYFTPAPYVFYTWNIIDILLLGFIVFQFLDGSDQAVKALGWRFSVIAVLNSIFLHVYVTKHYIVAFVFACLVASSVSTVYYTLRFNYPPRSNSDALFVHLPFSLWHAWSIVTVFMAGFAAFTHGVHGRPGVAVRVLVVLSEAFLALTAAGYAFGSKKGDLAGAAILTWVLWGIYDFQTSHLIHYFALGSFIFAFIAVAKSSYYTWVSEEPLIVDEERNPLLG